MFKPGDFVWALTGPFANELGRVVAEVNSLIHVTHAGGSYSAHYGASELKAAELADVLRLTTRPPPAPAAAPAFTVNANGGKKHTGGKGTANQVPEAFTEALSQHMDIGAVKYDFGNWWKGLTYSQPSESIRRHNARLRAGENVDTETKSSHWIAIAANAMMAWSLEQAGLLEDDRSKVFIDFLIEQTKTAAAGKLVK